MKKGFALLLIAIAVDMFMNKECYEFRFLMLPHFDPTIFTFGNSNIGLRWYGLMYLLGFIFARWLAVSRANQPNSGWTVDQVDTLLFNAFYGVF